MKRIIVICLSVSILIGAYEKTKQKNYNLSEQMAITIVSGATKLRDNSIQQQGQGVVENRVVSETPEQTPTEKPNETDHPSDEAIIKGKKHGDILWRVYALESSRGQNDGCKKQGKFNGFGFRQNSREFACYDHFEEVVYHVDNWFEEKLQTYDLATALCGYNLGFQSDYLGECVSGSEEYPYYRNFNSL